MKYEKDPVVEEVQRVRKEIFKECGYNTGKLFELLKEASRLRKMKSRKRILAHAADGITM